MKVPNSSVFMMLIKKLRGRIWVEYGVDSHQKKDSDKKISLNFREFNNF